MFHPIELPFGAKMLFNTVKLKPGVKFEDVEMAVGEPKPVLTVPDSAVIDTGARRIVLVQVQEGRFEPRDVELGARGENFVEVVKGVSDGEQVVVAANFLIDAESNLKAAISGFGSGTRRGTQVEKYLAPVKRWLQDFF